MIHQWILGTDLFINNYQMGGWTKQKWDLFNVFIKNTTNWPFHVIHSNFNVAEWFMCPMTRKGSFRSTGHGAVKLGVKAVSQGIERCSNPMETVFGKTHQVIPFPWSPCCHGVALFVTHDQSCTMSRDDSAGAVNAIHHGPKFEVPGLVGTGAAFSGADWQTSQIPLFRAR